MTPGEIIAWAWGACGVAFILVFLRDEWQDRDARKRIQRHLAQERPVVLYVVEPAPDLSDEASEDWLRDLESIQSLRVFREEEW